MPLLSKTSIGAGLRPDQLEVLVNRADVRSIASGESVLSRHDTEFPLMVLLSGEAEVRGLFGNGVSLLKPGALIGEIAWLDHDPRTADVIARTDAQVAVFPVDLLEKLDLEAPDLTAQLLYNVSKVLCSKLRWAQRLIDAQDAIDYPDR